MKKIIYPENYYDFSGGVDCSNEEINQWIKEGIEDMKAEIRNGVIKPSFNISTGNTMVWGNIYFQRDGKYTIEVCISKHYKRNTETGVIIN